MRLSVGYVAFHSPYFLPRVDPLQDEEIRRTIQILCRRLAPTTAYVFLFTDHLAQNKELCGPVRFELLKPCSRFLVLKEVSGEPGVGKTAVAEGLAQRMAAGQVPQNLKGTLYSLDLGALFAGAGKGEYEEVRHLLKCFVYLD